MCHRALTCIVERSIYLFILSNGKKKKKITTIPLEGSVFHALDPFGFWGVTNSLTINKSSSRKKIESILSLSNIIYSPSME